MTAPSFDQGAQLSRVLIALMKGVVYRDTAPAIWHALDLLQTQVRDYVAVIGLTLELDEGEGYAFLRQEPAAEGSDLPRLMARRQLGYPVSLLLALLRRKLAEADATTGETRVILSRDDIASLVRVFMPDSTNEARILDRMDSHLKRVIELGFLRRLEGQEDRYEIMRILKSFVDAQWLQEFDQRLAAYRALAATAGVAAE